MAFSQWLLAGMGDPRALDILGNADEKSPYSGNCMGPWGAVPFWEICHQGLQFRILGLGNFCHQLWFVCSSANAVSHAGAN